MKIKLLAIALTILSIGIIDNRLYYYGKSRFTNNTITSMNLKPNFWNWDLGNKGFIIEDKFGFVVIGNQTLIEDETDTILVDKIEKYCYNKDKLYFEIKDNKKLTKIIELTENINNNGEIFIKKVINTESIPNFDGLVCTDLEKNERLVYRLYLTINYLIIFLTILIIIFIRSIILKYKKL